MSIFSDSNAAPPQKTHLGSRGMKLCNVHITCPLKLLKFFQVVAQPRKLLLRLSGLQLLSLATLGSACGSASPKKRRTGCVTRGPSESGDFANPYSAVDPGRPRPGPGVLGPGPGAIGPRPRLIDPGSIRIDPRPRLIDPDRSGSRLGRVRANPGQAGAGPDRRPRWK